MGVGGVCGGGVCLASVWRWVSWGCQPPLLARAAVMALCWTKQGRCRDCLVMSAVEEGGLFVATEADCFCRPSPKGLPWFLTHYHRLNTLETEPEMWVCVQAVYRECIGVSTCGSDGDRESRAASTASASRVGSSWDGPAELSGMEARGPGTLTSH